VLRLRQFTSHADHGTKIKQVINPFVLEGSSDYVVDSIDEKRASSRENFGLVQMRVLKPELVHFAVEEIEVLLGNDELVTKLLLRVWSQRGLQRF